MNKPTLFIVDDHDIVVDGLEKIVHEMDDVDFAGRASNGKEALEKIPILKPDVVLMDLDMPVMNGLEATERLLKIEPDLKIVILTMHGEKSIVEKLMNLGTVGYFLKNADAEELKFGIRQVLQGKKYFHSKALFGFVEDKKLTKKDEEMEKLALLTEREIEVVKGVALGKTTAELAEEFHISTRTVETHRKNIIAKLRFKNITELVRFAIKSGIIT